MISIERSALWFLGREMECYGLFAVAGAALLTVVIALLARRRGLDASFAFRCGLVSIFSTAVFHVFFQNRMPQVALLLYYPLGMAALPLIFRMLARLFRQEQREFFRLGLLAVFGYSIVTRCCCLFAGCCYGPPWDGFLALVYGPATHNPLPGVPLFPLQPVLALVYLGILVFGAAVFLKNGPGILLALAALLNLAAYYTGILVSPGTAGGPLLAAAVTALYITALGLLTYCIITKIEERKSI